MEPWEHAVGAISDRAQRDRRTAEERVEGALGSAPWSTIDDLASNLLDAGRLTLNFHPDRIAADGRSVAAGLAEHGRYRSQWVTWISNGGRSARRGGYRHQWERALFAGAYEDSDPAEIDFPLYGALDLLRDPHGGSPRFGSCFIVLADAVIVRATLCVGDSHLGPSDVGSAVEPLLILAGLADQAQRRELLGRDLGPEALVDVLSGCCVAASPARLLDGYVEAQVHGGVDLAQDVEAIVADPSFRGTSVERDLGTAASRYGFDLRWHGGSELAVSDTPDDFRGPAMPALAQRVAGPRHRIDARAIGAAAALEAPAPPRQAGDPDDAEVQQLKYLWHTLLTFGHDADPSLR